MIDEQRLRSGLQKLLKETESAIRDRLEDEPSLQAQLKDRHDAAVRAERTEGSKKGFLAFSDEGITQAAVHWLLGCVFVRFLEDNGWLDERNAKAAWISGPGERLAIAKDRRTLFLRPDPGLTDRDYLLHVFAEVAKLPGVAGLFDQRHNPLYSLQPTAQGAAKIVEFFQMVDPDTNALTHDFSDAEHGTRFLGDLYQNLSESARKRYALCQTPGFVIDFILDRTLTPAVDVFGLETVAIIDPSCGSGHFLLAAFARLLRALQMKEPGTNAPTLVQRALDAIYGVDLNPFAVEISRFRLLIAALEATKIDKLRSAPSFHFNLAAGDSLLHGRLLGHERGLQRGLISDPTECFYATEDRDELKRILGRQYPVVVGNPPYINVSDPVLREVYRTRYGSCHGKYQLSVPFIERFFDLASTDNVGFVGLIVSNAFMKRQFGRKLVETYLPRWDVTHVIDTSGAHLPNHGVPTVILFGRARQPIANTVRVVRGIRGEKVTPVDPALAPVWSAIVSQVDNVGSESAWVSIADAGRRSFESHPWSIGGGGAAELKELLEERCDRRVGELCQHSGITAVAGEGEVYLYQDDQSLRRHHIERRRSVVEGIHLKDWQVVGTYSAIWPYDAENRLIPIEELPMTNRFLWPYRHHLGRRRRFGVPMVERGLHWFEWQELYPDKLLDPRSIAFGEVTTHNHFAYERDGLLYDNTTRVLKLGSDSDEPTHLALLAVLNSSTACFWLKQICHNKGTGGIGGGLATEPWEQFYALTSTAINSLPLPSRLLPELATKIQFASDQRAEQTPQRLCSRGTPSSELLEAARVRSADLLARMIALQEELDWQMYYLYGLLDKDPSVPLEFVPPLRLGERPFEIVMARQMKTGELETAWFERHRSTSVSMIPGNWPDPYRAAVNDRLRLIESNRDLSLLEQPENKRRWNLPTWEEMQQVALRGWLLERIEQSLIWNEDSLISCSQLRDRLARDSDWLSVAEIHHGGPIEALDGFVIDLVSPEAVPHLPVLRYTESGLRKRTEWEAVWELQRLEDAGEKVEIPVPPKYVTKDMQKGDYWRLRGGLDVPKERFILYAFFQRDSLQKLLSRARTNACDFNDSQATVSVAGTSRKPRASAWAWSLARSRA